MKDKTKYIIFFIISALIYYISLSSYVTTKDWIDLLFSVVSGIMTFGSLYLVYTAIKEQKYINKKCKKKKYKYGGHYA